VAVLAFFAATWQPALPPIDPPPAASFAPALVANGEKLATIAGCIDCHTRPGGARGTGGVPVLRLFGSIPSGNLTPDPETGIGHWSLAAFTRALREGIDRDGKRLFIAFPFDHFTKIADPDIAALYAYFMTLPPAKAPAAPNTLFFPFDVRALQAVWAAIYVVPGPYQPDRTQTAEWNRGAYLTEALLRCSACHTSHNLLGAEQIGHPYGGARSDDGWWTPPLDIPPSPVRWTAAELADYLRTGVGTTHGAALADMQRVTRSLRVLPDRDIAAIATYIASLALPPGPGRENAAAKAQSPPAPRNDSERNALKLYLDNCGGCHETPGATPDAAHTTIGLATSLWMDEPNNFVRIMLDGIRREEGVPGPVMPGFRHKLTDNQLGIIAEYLRTTRTVLSPWSEIQTMVGRIRAFTETFPEAR